jgi:hypothetical protein
MTGIEKISIELQGAISTVNGTEYSSGSSTIYLNERNYHA